MSEEQQSISGWDVWLHPQYYARKLQEYADNAEYLREQLSQSEAERREIIEEVASAKEVREEMEKRLEEMRREIETLREEKDALRRDIEEWERAGRKMEQTAEALEKAAARREKYEEEIKLLRLRLRDAGGGGNRAIRPDFSSLQGDEEDSEILDSEELPRISPRQRPEEKKAQRAPAADESTWLRHLRR